MERTRFRMCDTGITSAADAVAELTFLVNSSNDSRFNDLFFQARPTGLLCELWAVRGQQHRQTKH